MLVVIISAALAGVLSTASTQDARSCGDPGYVNNGRRQGSLFTFPNSVKYNCDEGYKIKGVATRYCESSGLWSGKLPECKIVTCNKPEKISNGNVAYDSLDYGSELRYTCNEGFKLYTDGTAYCTENGRWSKHTIECIESTCDVPEKPEHGSVTLSGNDGVPRSGTIAIYACDGDRVAYGATTSKCLDNGQWLFPAPQCLVPCSAPNMHNGKIGRYQRRTRYGEYYFSEISAGTKIEDDEELALRCSLGYQVGNSENMESKLSCSKGKWSLEPHCKPASCRNQPPRLENAEIVNINPEHGGKVKYHCRKDFKKIKEENVVCDFGIWKGASTSICQSTRCSRDQLRFPGLRKGYVISYEDNHLFPIKCEPGYQIDKEAEVRCSEGEWKSNVPPCVPANCTEPPAIPYTKVKKSSTSHGSYATYECQDSYKLIGQSEVQCSYGEWKNLPRCDDGRCEVKDLMYSSHISREETPLYVYSGQELHVTCNPGYLPRIVTPLCKDGRWTRDSKSPCRESDCLVPKLEHGSVFDKVYGDWYWDIWRFMYMQEVTDLKVPFGTLVSPGTIFYLYCDSGYSFQGSSEETRRITCTESSWHPDPVCIPRGTNYTVWSAIKSGLKKFYYGESTTNTPETTPVAVTTPVPVTTQPTSDSEVRLPEVVTTYKPTTVEPVIYSCQYPVKHESLVATVDGRQLYYLDNVSEGSVVQFRCLHVGYHRFRGPLEMKCERSQNWQSSYFPTCSKPSRKDTVIVYEHYTSVSSDGNLEVKKGQNLTLWCIAYEGGIYPNWTIPTQKGVTISEENKIREDHEDVLYMSKLKIEKADLENEGIYYCSIIDDVATTSTMTVIVIDPSMQCPEFEEDYETNIIYSNERRVQSKATFSCRYQARELKGKAVVKCLTNGNWSDPPPQCHEIKCKILQETEHMKIVYEGDRKAGSLATFHCADGASRTGASFAICMENGSWAHSAPACDYPPCVWEELYSSLPQNAMPERHHVGNSTFPYNTEVLLKCENNLNAFGNPIAKCGKNKMWLIEKFQCRSGCPAIPITPDLILKVEPVKDVYNFGDMVQFSCPPGMKLNMGLQRVVCMNGWSETHLPHCIEDKNQPGT